MGGTSKCGQAPDLGGGGEGRKLPPGLGRAISQDPLKCKMYLHFNPAVPLLEVCLGIALGHAHGLGKVLVNTGQESQMPKTP